MPKLVDLVAIALLGAIFTIVGTRRISAENRRAEQAAFLRAGQGHSLEECLQLAASASAEASYAQAIYWGGRARWLAPGLDAGWIAEGQALIKLGETDQAARVLR